MTASACDVISTISISLTLFLPPTTHHPLPPSHPPTHMTLTPPPVGTSRGVSDLITTSRRCPLLTDPLTETLPQMPLI